MKKNLLAAIAQDLRLGHTCLLVDQVQALAFMAGVRDGASQSELKTAWWEVFLELIKIQDYPVLSLALFGAKRTKKGELDPGQDAKNLVESWIRCAEKSAWMEQFCETR